MSALREQQEQLLQALWQSQHHAAIEFAAGCDRLLASTPDPAQWQRGLKAYRSNAHELAQRALSAAYPVVAQLLGDDNFRALAQAHWLAHPPQRGDVAQWGGALAVHIEALPDLAREEPFMADVARVEWLLHIAASATDPALDTSSFELMTISDPQNLTLVLGPAVACVASAWPVVSLVAAHTTHEVSFDEAAQRLAQGVAETAIVWRDGYRPRLRTAAQGEAAFIAALQEKQSLADALQLAGDFDFTSWLSPAAQSGMIVAAALL
jgi:hypothetical protein